MVERHPAGRAVGLETAADPVRHPLLQGVRRQRLDLPCREVALGDELLFELVRKNVYILTTNIAGLKTGGTVSQLWAQHEAYARQVANDVMDIQDALTGRQNDRDALIAGMLEAFDGDPDHGCTGRSAPARLARAIGHADEFGLAVPTLRALAG